MREGETSKAGGRISLRGGSRKKNIPDKSSNVVLVLGCKNEISWEETHQMKKIVKRNSPTRDRNEKGVGIC